MKIRAIFEFANGDRAEQEIDARVIPGTGPWPSDYQRWDDGNVSYLAPREVYRDWLEGKLPGQIGGKPKGVREFQIASWNGTTAVYRER